MKTIISVRVFNLCLSELLNGTEIKQHPFQLSMAVKQSGATDIKIERTIQLPTDVVSSDIVIDDLPSVAV